MLLLLALINAIPAEPGQTDTFVKRKLVDRVRYLLNDAYCLASPGIKMTGGRVTEVTEDTITVRSESGWRYTFEASPALASKQIPLTRAPFTGHRLNQVRVGDIVFGYVVPTPRGYVVIALGITRRPGGKIPVAEDDHLHASMRLHVLFGKDQAIEEARDATLRKVARTLARIH